MRVHELIEDDDSFYIVSELLEGGDLDKKFKTGKHFNEQ